jgi:hypothetical protein
VILILLEACQNRREKTMQIFSLRKLCRTVYLKTKKERKKEKKRKKEIEPWLKGEVGLR